MLQHVADSTVTAARAVADTTLRHEIFRRFDALAAKTGVAVEYLWGVLVRQAYAEFAIGTIWFLIWGTAAFITIRNAKKSWASGLENADTEKRWRDSDSIQVTFWTIVAVICTIGFLFASSGFATGVGYLVNPDYFAFERAAQFIFGPKGH